MPPKIALSLCSLFIFILFRIDKRKRPDFPSALRVPLVWIMIAGSRPVSYWLNPTHTGGGDITTGDPTSRLVLIILMVLGLFILSKRKLDWTNIWRNNTWLIVLFFYVGISVFWSAYPAVSIKRLFRAIGDIVMVLVVLTEKDPLAAIMRVFRKFAYVVIPLSLTLSKYFPKIGTSYTQWGGDVMWVGVTNHKNSLGIVSCISALVFLWAMIREYRNNKIIYTDMVMLLMSLFLLFYGKATSSTAIMVFIIAIFLFIVLSKFKSKPKSIGRFVVSFFLVFLLLSPVIKFAVEYTVVDLLGRDMTLTDRTILWESFIKVGSSRSAFGSGYGSFWLEVRGHPMWDDLPGPEHKQAHNGYLNVWLELGFVGLGILIVLIFVTYKNILKGFEFNFEYCQIRIALLSMVLLHNVTEATFLRGTDFVWLLFLLATVFVPVNPSAAFGRNQNPRVPLQVKDYNNILLA